MSLSGLARVQSKYYNMVNMRLLSYLKKQLKHRYFTAFVVNRNKLKIIDNRLFKGLYNLHEINLKDNNIYSINHLAFKDNSQLEIVYLSNNNLQQSR